MTRGYGSNIQPSLARPSIASHKGGYPIWAAGAEMPPWKNFLRPPGNSPSRWHLTRHLLLCSGVTIHDLSGNVNTFFSKLLRNDCEKWSLNDTQNRKKMSLRGGPLGRRGNLLPVGRTMYRKIVPYAAFCSKNLTFFFCFRGDCHVGPKGLLAMTCRWDR